MFVQAVATVLAMDSKVPKLIIVNIVCCYWFYLNFHFDISFPYKKTLYLLLAGVAQSWQGAIMTFLRPDDCKHVPDQFQTDSLPFIVPIYIPEHLKLVGYLEDRLDSSYKSQGTTVMIRVVKGHHTTHGS